MECIELRPVPADAQYQNGFLGGAPPLPTGSDWPSCRICGELLVHFIDVQLPMGSSPFQEGSRLQIFACRQHDDIAGTIYSDFGQFESASGSRRLPEKYWTISDGHYLIRLIPPGAEVIASRPETRLALRNLRQERSQDSRSQPKTIFKLFGHPSWLQEPVKHECCCGASMELLMQVPANFTFDMVPGAAEQPNSSSKTHYSLFLGNELYLLACTAQCHPLALWPVVQN